MSQSKLDSDVLTKAIKSLYKYENNQQSNKGHAANKLALLAGYSKPIFAQVQLNSEIKRAVIKPTRIAIPHSLFSPDEEDHSVCLFCRSDDKKEIEEFHSSEPIIGVTKILSINDVKKYCDQLKDKKALLKAHTHFVCDARIAQHLYNLLGLTFSARNNLPVQINFTKPSMLPKIIHKVVNSTYCQLKGINVSIRFGHLGMRAEDVLENILEGIPCFVSKLKNEWKDVHSIHIKTSDSASLPVYSKSADAMLQYIIQKASSSAEVVADQDKKKVAKKAKSDKDKSIIESSSRSAKKEGPSSSGSKVSLLKVPVKAKSLVTTSSNTKEGEGISKKRSLSVTTTLESNTLIDDATAVGASTLKKTGPTRLEPPVKRSKIPKPLSKKLSKAE